MKDYAIILSYLETCYRNGISRYAASKRLVQDNPYTVSEIKEIIKEKRKWKRLINFHSFIVLLKNP